VQGVALAYDYIIMHGDIDYNEVLINFDFCIAVANNHSPQSQTPYWSSLPLIQ
jgi:hypothetical protein